VDLKKKNLVLAGLIALFAAFLYAFAIMQVLMSKTGG
jgi:hypothetical protein